MAVIGLFLQQTLRSNLGDFLRCGRCTMVSCLICRACWSSADGTAPDPLAELMSLFIVRSHSYFALVYLTQYPWQGNLFFPPPHARMLIYRSSLMAIPAAEFIAERAPEDVVDKILLMRQSMSCIPFRTLRCAGGKPLPALLISGTVTGPDNPWTRRCNWCCLCCILPLDILEDMRTRAPDLQRETPHCQSG